MAGVGATQTGGQMELPRFDAEGQPICFKCRLAGHIARQCRMGPPIQRAPPVSRMATSQDISAQAAEQQGNFFPLWECA